MNLIKHEKGNKNGCPRWVYENNNHIIKDIKNYYQKAIKFYKKMTLNTVLENCEFNLEELAIKSYINIADSKEN